MAGNGKRPQPDSNGNGPQPPEFDRFEELTRKLVKVPKTELDKAREQEKAEKS